MDKTVLFVYANEDPNVLFVGTFDAKLRIQKCNIVKKKSLGFHTLYTYNGHS